MTITMEQALSFQKFYDQIKEYCCSLKTSYKLNKLETLIAAEINFYNQKFSAIVQEYAKKDDNGNYIYSADGASIEIMDGKVNECQAKVIELQNLEIQLPDITFNIEEFDELDIDISIMELQALMPFMAD